MREIFKQGARENLQAIDDFLYALRQPEHEVTLPESLLKMLIQAEYATAYFDGYFESKLERLK